MDVTVLGSLRVREDGVDYSPTAPKPRQLLALLALYAGKLVSMDGCVQELWPSGPPRSATSTIHTYIMQIRKSISQVPSVDRPRCLLARLESGYRLDLAAHMIDLNRFRDKAWQGRRALRECCDYAQAVACFQTALLEWEGGMLSGVRTGPLLDAHVAKATEERITVLEQCFEARLKLGLHHELIHELAELVHQHPANENLVAQYMVALYRSDRQADALGAYQRLQTTLDEELAIMPSARLRSLHWAVLAQDPSLQAPERPILSSKP